MKVTQWIRALSLLWTCAGLLPLSAQTVTILATFNGANGRGPNALILGNDGNLYGTTGYGGSGACTLAGFTGCGTVFQISQITQRGSLTTLHNFNIADGAYPGVALGHTLTLGQDGNIYGATTQGGDLSACTGTPKGCGTIYKITTGGTLTTLHEFQNTASIDICNPASNEDGGIPYNPPIQGSDGNFYGTTYDQGTFYQMTPDGQVATLFVFPSYSNPAGSSPVANPVQGPDGNFYGSTLSGTLFKISAAGDLTTLYTFGTGTGMTIPLVLV